MVIAAGALLGSTAAAAPPVPTGSFPIVELRQYTLHEGQRDVLIDLFEREFVESQEAQGMKVIGTFRDLDRPNRFVWLRGYRDMDSRLAGLSGFYFGPLWLQHRNAANATIEDSDNVLLLHAPDARAIFKAQPLRPRLGENRPSGLIIATIDYLSGSPADAAQLFESKVKPRLEKAGIAPLAWFVPETAANNFPRLPVREGEKALVWFTRFESAEDYAARKAAIDQAEAPLAPLLAKTPEVLRLAPTSRSELR
jgi:hypothetical protein